MSANLEIALLFLIMAIIVVLGFLVKLIIDLIKLVKNLDETTTMVKTEVEPTIKELNKTLANLNSLAEGADKQVTDIRKFLSGFLGLSSVTLGGVKNILSGLIKGIIAGVKIFTTKK